ncbi:hypothetical protein Ancab_005953 [Ancistrocladus abbreviatus]
MAGRPRIQIEPDQPVYVNNQMISNYGRSGEAQRQQMHSLMHTPVHHQQRMLPDQSRYRTRVTTFKQLPLTLHYEPVRFRIDRENRRLSENMGSGDELESLADKREAEVARRVATVAAAGVEEEDEREGEEDGEVEGEQCREIHICVFCECA